MVGARRYAEHDRFYDGRDDDAECDQPDGAARVLPDQRERAAQEVAESERPQRHATGGWR